MDYFDLRPQRFYLLSTKSRRLFSFHSKDRSLEKEVEHFFSSIKKVEGGNIYAEYKFEEYMLQDAIVLSERLKAGYPSIQQLPTYFRQLSEGDYFIRHHANAPVIDLKRSIIKVKAHSDGESEHTYDNIFVKNWGKLYLKFDTYSYGFLTDKIKVGEPDKDRRVCRFCGKTGRDLFKKDAHAIAEALGNKLLFCNEECDECNQTFESNVEKYLFKFCEIQRTLANISGKGSQSHHLEGLNFHIHPDPVTLRPVVYVMNEFIVNDVYRGLSTGRINLYNKGKISYWGIYKSLTKIAVDMMPADRFLYFKRTAQWVHGDFDEAELPPFLYGEHSDFFEQPVLDLFFRNGYSPVLSPYCTGILYLYNSIFIFVVPLCSMDEEACKTQEAITSNYEYFKNKQYLYVQEWEVLDSNDKELLTPFYKLSLFDESAGYKYEFRPQSDNIFEIKRD